MPPKSPFLDKHDANCSMFIDGDRKILMCKLRLPPNCFHSIDDLTVDVATHRICVSSACDGVIADLELPLAVDVQSYDSSASAQFRRSQGILKIELRIAAATPLRISKAEERRWRVHQVVPFVPTDSKIIQAALELSGVGKSDIIVDVGCGDGRVCVAAALRGAHAIGYDCDAACLSVAAISAAEAGVAHSCSFVLSDFLTQRPLVPDGTSVVYLHLYPEIVERLRPRLLEILDAGVRIITFAMSHLRGVRAARTAKAGQLEFIDFSILREFFDEPLEERLRFD
eukprot:gnl/MRDRNA2_/MRDRNA2_189119_c0_seq1.p1 gnl/MRDRNA2_/MRDRNA2_189119_c0~~gnl/MRDRNA2_/MRDRNA2_189119_c0_seq1.p1  ORF type:complete len:284 (-),score=49.98 gnl/MRDRNA2_/MRDRNA2_189119_c0_seq1:534-1385(-)